MLELKSDGQEAIVTQFADEAVSWNENGMSVRDHMCSVLGACGRQWSALRLCYCFFKILIEMVQFDLIEN